MRRQPSKSSNSQLIRILYIGDAKTGKTSLIAKCAGHEEDGKGSLPWVMNPVLLPVENKLEDFSTILIDTPSDISESENDMATKIKNAHVVLILYDMTDEQTVNNIRDFWLPFVGKYNQKVPVIIVGNKLDLIRTNNELSYFTRISKILRPLMRDFPQVQMGIEVSARESKNILEMLYCAQSSVIFPLSPLICPASRELTPKFRKALTRIFRILDVDNNGRLSDQELGALQERVFESDLNPEDLKGLKDIVKDEAREHYNPRFVTLEGFFTIHRHLLQLMKIKNSWLILKNFGYDKKLDLYEELFSDTLIQPAFSSVELKEKAVLYIKKMFAKFSDGASNNLGLDGLQQIFEPLEVFPEEELRRFSTLYQSERSELSASDWDMFWAFLTYVDYKLAYRYLYYIGLEEKLSAVMAVSK